MKAAAQHFYKGYTWHTRTRPKQHTFRYPYSYAQIQLTKATSNPTGQSTGIWPLLFRRTDYFSTKDSSHADAQESLYESVALSLQALTGKKPQQVDAYVQPRSFGRYFSPVNFYIGYVDAHPELLLAEVSNTPWGERHCYAVDFTVDHSQPKTFKVSPFNPVDQQYHWELVTSPEHLRIVIQVTDDSGLVFSAGIDLVDQGTLGALGLCQRLQFATQNRMTLLRIYWHAALLFFGKRLPFLSHPKNTINN